jgi:Arc/MetJ family transcription regulator
MRATVHLDDDLVAEAERLTGTSDRTALIRLALTALVERESAARLASLGGGDPDVAAPPRRRPT